MAVDRQRLAASLFAIVDETVEAAELPERLCAECLTTLPVDGVGLSLMGGHRVTGRALLGASDPVGARLEELQVELGEGPCASAHAERQPVLVPDLSSGHAYARWPMFTSGTRELPVRALFAFPLQLGTISIGAMDCYRASPGPLNEVTEALVVAEAVTLALLQAQARDSDSAAEDSRLVAHAVGRHAEVHQATGMISAQLEITTEEAFVRLRAYAYRHERSLKDVAADVVARKLRWKPDQD